MSVYMLVHLPGSVLAWYQFSAEWERGISLSTISAEWERGITLSTISAEWECGISLSTISAEWERGISLSTISAEWERGISLSTISAEWERGISLSTISAEWECGISLSTISAEWERGISLSTVSAEWKHETYLYSLMLPIELSEAHVTIHKLHDKPWRGFSAMLMESLIMAWGTGTASEESITQSGDTHRRVLQHNWQLRWIELLGCITVKGRQKAKGSPC